MAVLRRTDDDASVARFTLHSHYPAKLDRFVAQARRHATRAAEKLAAVAVEIDTAGAVSVSAGCNCGALAHDRWIRLIGPALLAKLHR